MLAKYTDQQVAEVVDWLNRGEFDCMVTLTFCPQGSPIHDDLAEKTLGRLVSKYMKATRPRKSKRKVVMAPFLERTTLDEPHFHILLRRDSDVETTKKLLREIWTKLDSNICGDPLVHDKKGDKWFKEIATPHDRRCITEYVTKWCTNLDGLVLKYTHLGSVGH